MATRTKLAAALHQAPNRTLGDTDSARETLRAGQTPQTVSVQQRIGKLQGIGTDQFLYFFLRLRKGEVRRVVQRAQSLYPGETSRQLARRLINAQSTLSFFGGALLHLPGLLPGAGTALKLAGFAGGASVVTRMHLYLILEIAHLHGHDIDDQARVPEMMAIVAASGIASASPWLIQALDWHRLAAIPAAGVGMVATTQLIGAAAIRYYSKAEPVPAAQLAPAPAAA
jgi:hypothetical protein